MRGRGLKLFDNLFHLYILHVAPHAGAWIETVDELNGRFTVMSPPMRGRGLKHLCGLGCLQLFAVAPHAGAWIET